ncbi:hypothetical protein BDA99DRAFT_497335 [Phascolomyces articulosus]|uniref:Uncharacterized protein n=1 Tax=Phascolomyces articulosus TaxID=60185 RepID=A0AAD5PI91_9FUNG|nr:hypothetical protein BDA99DRAFT_497335 [Phascolomyces articulosus]
MGRGHVFYISIFYTTKRKISNDHCVHSILTDYILLSSYQFPKKLPLVMKRHISYLH